MEALRESLVIAGQSLRITFRSPRAILLLVIASLAATVAGAVVIWAMSGIQAQLDAQLAAMAPDMSTTDLANEKAAAYQELVAHIVGDEDKAAYLSRIPLLVIVVFLGLRSFLPWFAVLLGYDQINSELQDRSARYTLLRARRGAFLTGKVLSVIVMLGALTIIVNFVIFAMAALLLDGLDTLLAARHLIFFWLLSLPIGFCWVAFMAFLSASIRSPYLSLLTGLACLVGTGLLGWTARIVETLGLARWVVPWHYGGLLLSPPGFEQILGISGLLLFAVLFFVLAYLSLRWRDI